GLALAHVAAVCPLLDPATTMDRIESGLPLYDWYFARKWRRSLQRKRSLFPQRHDFDDTVLALDIRALTDWLVQRHTAFGTLEAYFDGYAIGGLAVGEGHQAMCEVLDYAPEMLPADRPRYLMGVGKPVDLVEAVYRGVDMFDCVLPTRAGRHGQAWTWDGPLNLKNARFAEDQDPLDPTIPCPASSACSKAYLHHLIRADEILGKVLLSWHNIAFYQALTAAMRAAIAEGRFEAFRRDFHARHVSNG
ncbi:tRNA guanosine(34) transglycosylase Tgt, partial [Brevundimonas sp.]|uniref:tRNA-guanine transglycosylase n=1 Tax=Brevundimonas sp. TaxID=1871086 RepID=UPI0025C5022A